MSTAKAEIGVRLSLSSLLRANMAQLVHEWATYAKEHIEAAALLTSQEVEDSALSLFTAMADDMEAAQSEKEQFEKSQGTRPGNCQAIIKHAHDHAEHRARQGFSLMDVFSEYRAARASVMRLWSGDGRADGVSPSEIERFNESIDEATQVSIATFDAQLNKSRDLFLGVLGHDMRSPLGAIMLLCQILLHDDTLSPDSTKAAARIHSSGSRLSHMLNDLLDFTRTRLGKPLPVTLVEGNVGETVSHVVDELRAYHPSADIKCETRGDLQGRWDFGRLSQVVSNLGGNAIQHGDKAYPVSIALDGMDEKVLLTVHNEGPAIPYACFWPMAGILAGINCRPFPVDRLTI